eukprot:363353-Chlamydomonas_euryale.AAC.5
MGAKLLMVAARIIVMSCIHDRQTPGPHLWRHVQGEMALVNGWVISALSRLKHKKAAAPGEGYAYLTTNMPSLPQHLTYGHWQESGQSSLAVFRPV